MLHHIIPALPIVAVGIIGIALPTASAAQSGAGTEVRYCSVDDRGCLRLAQALGHLVTLNAPGGSPSNATPVTYRDVTFENGNAAFADEIVDYSPGSPGPASAYAEAGKVLAAPDWKGGSRCRNAESCSFVSLGRGGSLTVRFTDNDLAGDGTEALDLWVFEVGPQVEDMFVEVSKDGIDWIAVGSIGGGRSGVDLDAFGLGANTALSYVRLTDDPDKDGNSGPTVGADIDAIGAVSSSTPKKQRCFCE